MKITINVTSNEANSIVDSTKELMTCVGKSTDTVEKCAYELGSKCRRSMRHYISGGYVEGRFDHGQYDLNINMEEGAFSAAVEVLVKLFLMVWPLIVPFVKLPGALKAFKATYKDTVAGIWADYNKKYKPDPTYGVQTLLLKDLNAACAVVVENDNLGNEPHVVVSHWVSGKAVCGHSALTRAWATREQEAKLINASGHGLMSETEFTFTSQKEAEDYMEENCVNGLRADWDGMQREYAPVIVLNPAHGIMDIMLVCRKNGEVIVETRAFMCNIPEDKMQSWLKTALEFAQFRDMSYAQALKLYADSTEIRYPGGSVNVEEAIDTGFIVLTMNRDDLAQ